MPRSCWPTDAANGFLFQPQFPTIAKKDVKGLWKDMPIFVNDLSALSWGTSGA